MKAGVIVLLLCIGGCLCFPGGPPVSQNFTAVCEQLLPLQGPVEDQQPGDGGFQVLTNLTQDNAGGFIYASAQTYSVIIISTNGSFSGFIVQARSVPDGNLTGEFTVSDPNLQQTLNCDPAGVASKATASHRNVGPSDNFQAVSLLWTAPNVTDLAAGLEDLVNLTSPNISSPNISSPNISSPNISSPATGTVNITFSIVVNFTTYFIARNAADQPYTGTPGLVNPLDYQLTYRTPSGCIPPDCLTYVGVNVSNVPGYLQLYLEGQAQAWVAMGYSLTRNMFDADVMACNLNSTGLVELLDTWNPSSPRRTNIVDTVQDGVLLNASAVNGVITCTFVRSINGTIVDAEDINLNQTLYGMWGVGQNPSDRMIRAHEVTPPIAIPETSFQPLNPVLNTDADRVSQPSNDSAAYNLTYRTPSGCLPPNCSSFVGVNVNTRNPAYLDFFLQGQGNAWVAMGYSLTRNMFDADIMACNVNPDTGLVELIDAWTPSSPQRAAITDTQQDLTLISSSVQDGIITCTFVTTIDKTIVGQEDLNLNQSLFGMWGVGQNQAAGRLLQHSVNPDTSIQPLSPAADTDQNRIVETPRDPEDYRLTLRQPANCTASNCSIFVGIATNNRSDQFLDIYMEAQTTTWVAAGFTQSRSMFDADVLACNLNPATGTVQALDTWNPSQPTRANIVDDMQDVVLFSSNVTDGRISCTMARYIPGSADEIGSGATEDINLNGSYFILYGVGPAPPATAASNSLVGHDGGAGNPRATAVTVNPVLDNETALTAVGGIPATVQQPNRNPADSRLTMRNPPGCDPTQCDIFVGISTNTGDNQYLDITIQGNSQGWLAVGFSDTQNMLSADVLGCSVNSDTGLVQVVDTWNLDQGRGNVGDAVQDTFLFQGTSDGQRISCTFGRLTAGSDTTGTSVQDFNLNNPYFGMFGMGPSSSNINLPAHNLGAGSNPTLTGRRVNPATDTGDAQGDPTRPMLIRAHGILMIIAWPLMAVTAIFFAAWMRPALPNGQWFQIHRILMSGSIFVAALGFLLIFVANRNNTPPGLITLGSANPVGTTHYVIGITVMFLHILNPLIAICRCKPDGKFRWIFNLIHGSFVGMVAELLALTNVGIGLAIFGSALSSTGLAVFYVYIVYLGFFLSLTFVLFLLYTILAYTSSGEDKSKLVPSLVKPLVSKESSYSPANTVDKGVELVVPGSAKSATNDDQEELSKPKPPSKDAPVRWFSLLVYSLAMIPAMIILVILVAI